MEETYHDSVILATLKQDLNSLHNLLKTQLDPLILTTRLYDATIKGDLNSLHNLLRQDPFILDRCIIQKSDRFMQSPLHVAANLGHLEFTKEILRLKPELAKQLDQSTRSSPLHLASEKGHLDIVKKLFEVMPNMCFARDRDGQNPVHVAVISNHLHVLEFLVRMNPRAARERTNSHETILHLCVKYAQLEPLKYSVNAIGGLLNAQDHDGNTVLHLAVVFKQPEVVNLLVANKSMQQNVINKNGQTAIDCLLRNGGSLDDTEIEQMLKRAKALEKQKNKDAKWLNKQRNTLMVVASLIATMAFQLGVNPNWGPVNPKNTGDLSNFDNLMIANTIAFVSSLSVVLVLIGGLPWKRLSVFVLMITMWVAITATLSTYLLALRNPSNTQLHSRVYDKLSMGLQVWHVLLLVLLAGHILRASIKLAKKLVQLVKKLWCKFIVDCYPIIGMASFSVGL